MSATGPSTLSRRTMLTAAAATAVTTPALAEGCRVGPPPHEKGPLVWMDLDQIELDTAYDQVPYAPMIGQLLKRRASNSAALRERIGPPMRLAK